MTATSAGFGLRPVRHGLGGEIRNEVLLDGITTGTTSSIFSGDPVTLSSAAGTLQLGGPASAMYGVLQGGVQYIAANGTPVLSPYWPGATTATRIQAYYIRDPNVIYEVQANGPLTQSSIGDEYDMVATGSGSTLTGQSNGQLSSTPAGAGSTKPWRVVGLGQGPYPGGSNAWGDAYTIVQVMPSAVSGFLPGVAV